MSEETELTKLDKKTSGLIKQESINQDLQKQEAFGQEILDRKLTLFRKIFPSATDKKVEEYKVKLITTLSDGKLENVRMVKEFERQVLKEALDSILTQGKVETRKRKAEFFALHTRDLQTKIMNLTDEYWDEILIKKAELEKIKDHEIQARKKKQLVKRMDEFEHIIDTLMDEFKNIINEGV